MPRLVQGRNQVLGEMQSHERNGCFNRIFADGTTINAGRIDDKKDNRRRLESPPECCDLVLAFAALEPLLVRVNEK